NIAAGALFGLWWGLALCCLLTTIGASAAYFLSDTFGKACLLHYFGERISSLQQSIKSSGRTLFWFLVFARIFPISPGWLLNIAAPVLDIPFYSFLASTFVGT
uniref:Transmembrane protein 41A n=1 Tax=Plectus sambesii TaxID=2011161 RepID=A0A914VEN2_9BILA